MVHKTFLFIYLLLLCHCRQVDQKSQLTQSENPPGSFPRNYNLAQGCETHFLGSPWRCPETRLEFLPKLLSESSLPVLNRLPLQTKVGYSFYCQFNGPPPKGQITSQDGAIKILIAPTEAPEINHISFVTNKDKPIKISIYFDPLTFINGACQLSVVSIESLAPLEVLELYASYLIEVSEWVKESLVAFDEASTLGEKWNVLEDLPEHLEKKTNTEIRKCRRRVEDLRQAQQTPENPDSVREIAKILGSGTEKPDLNRLCPAPFDANMPTQNPCLASIDLLTEDGDIGLIQYRIKESACLARDLREGMPSTEECFKDGTESHLCLKVLQEKRSVLAGKKSTALEPRILGLADFLKAEILRLSGLSDSLTQDLKELLNRLYEERG